MLKDVGGNQSEGTLKLSRLHRSFCEASYSITNHRGLYNNHKKKMPILTFLKDPSPNVSGQRFMLSYWFREYCSSFEHVSEVMITPSFLISNLQLSA